MSAVRPGWPESRSRPDLGRPAGQHDLVGPGPRRLLPGRGVADQAHAAPDQGSQLRQRSAGDAQRRPGQARCPTRPPQSARPWPAAGRRRDELAEQRVGEPPPTIWTVLTRWPVTRTASRTRAGWRRCHAVQEVPQDLVDERLMPLVRRQAWVIRRVIAPGAAKPGSWTSMRRRRPGISLAAPGELVPGRCAGLRPATPGRTPAAARIRSRCAGSGWCRRSRPRC